MQNGEKVPPENKIKVTLGLKDRENSLAKFLEKNEFWR